MNQSSKEKKRKIEKKIIPDARGRRRAEGERKEREERGRRAEGERKEREERGRRREEGEGGEKAAEEGEE